MSTVMHCELKGPEFRRLNLVDPRLVKKTFDVIFCPSVMIYFDRETQSMIHRFHDKLVSGGNLIIGHSESRITIRHAFAFVQSAVYRKGGAGA